MAVGRLYCGSDGSSEQMGVSFCETLGKKLDVHSQSSSRGNSTRSEKMRRWQGHAGQGERFFFSHFSAALPQNESGLSDTSLGFS